MQPDPFVPEAGNPQSLNRYSYVLNNPMRLSDPSGYWSEEELAQRLGEDWRETYFGEGAAFEGRDNLRALLLSEETESFLPLSFIHPLLDLGRLYRAAGVNLNDYDAIGARLWGSAGAAMYAEFTADVVLNLTSGEFSLFASEGLGFSIGAQAVSGVGQVFIKNMPKNEEYRGYSAALGLAGASGTFGINMEAFSCGGEGNPISQYIEEIDDRPFGVTWGTEVNPSTWTPSLM